MKIVHINLIRTIGGGEIQILCLMRELRARGVDQCLIARSRGQLYRMAQEEGFVVYDFSVAVFVPWHACWRGSSTVVHAHDGRANHVAAWIKQLRAVPYVLTRRLVTAPRSHRRTKSVYRKADQVVAVSQSIAKALDRWQPGLNCRVIYDALVQSPVDACRANELRKSASAHPIVVQVGRLSAEKGADLTVRIAKELTARGYSMQFWIVGDGPERPQLEEAAAGSDNIVFFGYRSNVGDFLEAADFLVHPSRHEGFGSVILQAMDHSAVVVASRVGGIVEALDDGHYGVLVDPNDVEGFCVALADLCIDRAAMAKFASLGRRRALEFSTKRMVDGYLSVYSDIVTPRLADKNLYSSTLMCS